ncbi:MAG: DNA phosphorothioation system sulfurtransferase DndC, partial [Desulfovibrionales bacterium]
MRPLIDFRNDIDFRGEEQRRKDRQRRDFRRMNGSITMNDSGAIPGPYTQKSREDFLRRILRLQRHVDENAPEDMKGVQVITLDELEEIRRIWVEEKHEVEDLLPKIYE